jgi:hypothetical protein
MSVAVSKSPSTAIVPKPASTPAPTSTAIVPHKSASQDQSIVPHSGNPQAPPQAPSQASSLKELEDLKTKSIEAGQMAQNAFPSYSSGSSAPPPQQKAYSPQKTIDLEIFNEIFKYIYLLLCISVVGIIFVITTVSIIDVVSYIIKELIELYNSKIDSKIFIKDTTAYKLMDYGKSAATLSSEPQYIYFIANIFKIIYSLAGATAIVLGVHIIIYIIIWVFAEFGGDEPKNIIGGLHIPYEYILPIIIGTIGILILDYGLYNSIFVKKIIENLKKYKEILNDTKKSIYTDMSVDPEFLNVLKSNDYNNIIIKYANIINNNQGNALSVNSFPYRDLVAALITHSLMTMYNTKIPEVDFNHDIIMKFFTYEEILAKTFDPLQYMYYKHTSNISNVWSIVRDDIQKILEDPNGMNNKKFFNTSREDAVTQTVDVHLRDINRNLTKLYTLPTIKTNIFLYLFAFAVMSILVFVIVIFSISADNLHRFFEGMQMKLLGGNKTSKQPLPPPPKEAPSPPRQENLPKQEAPSKQEPEAPEAPEAPSKTKEETKAEAKEEKPLALPAPAAKEEKALALPAPAAKEEKAAPVPRPALPAPAPAPAAAPKGGKNKNKKKNNHKK